jgi:hypothetical protein
MRYVLYASVLLGACGADKTPVDTAPDVADELHVMRDCEPAPGRICPWAGDGYNGFNGESVDRFDAWFSFPMSATISDRGDVILADWNNHKLRRIESDDTLTTVMGTDFLGDGDADHLDATPDGAPGTSVALNHPTMQAYFEDGLLLSASWHTHKLRTWDPITGLVHVICGMGAGTTGNDPEPIEEALLNQPKEVLIDDAGDVYVLDMRNEQIRFLDMTEKTLKTIAGNGTKDYCGDGGPAMEACFNFPMNTNPEPGGAIALDEEGQLLYVADTESHIIRVIDLEAGTIDLLAGQPMVPGDVDGPGLSAMFSFPTDLQLDGDSLFVADANNHKVRVIDRLTGEVSTFAGTGEPSCFFEGDVAVPQICDEQHRGGDGGPAVDATLYRPFGVDLDLDGNLVIADSYNQRFRIVYR